MTRRTMSEHYGLTPVQERIWKYVRGAGCVRMVDIRHNVFEGYADYPILQPIRVCIKRGYLVERAHRVYAALDPPYEQIVSAAIKEAGTTPKELFSNSRNRRACRARRLITRRLRALGYPCSDIGRLLKRSAGIVAEYSNPELRLKRSIARRQTYLRQRAEQQLGA